MMKSRIKLLTLCLLLSLSLSSCATNNDKIGLFLYDESDTFVSLMDSTLKTELENDYDIETFDAKKSQSIQNKQIIKKLNENPNVLLINMVDRLAAASIIQKANQTDTPVIFFNREPVYSDIAKYKNAYYVGTNPVQEGINQAIMAQELMGNPKSINKKIDKNGDNKLQCVFIQGEANHQDTEKRTYACINYLQDLGYELDILAMDSADWNKDKGKSVMATIYTKFEDNIEFLFSNNDDMAVGAIEYLNQNKKIKKTKDGIKMPFPIVGVDGTDSGIQAVADGYMYGTTINDSTKQAKAISMLLKLLNNKISMNDFKKEFSFSKTKNNFIYVSGSLVSQKNINNLK